MATWDNINPTPNERQDDTYIVYQNGINYLQTLQTLSAAVDQGEWTNTFDYSVNDITRGSDGKRYIALQESGPNNGGSIQPVGDVSNTWKDWDDYLQDKIDASKSSQFNYKSDYDTPSLIVDATDLKSSQDFSVVVNNQKVDVSADTSVTLPTLSNATDYKVYAADDGTLSAQEYDNAAPANSVLVGGFHAAYSDASIVERSLWDFAWKPATGSPRAMALTLSGRVWADIYKMDTEYGVNGYSRPDAQIADGDSLPLRSLAYGGDGAAAYPDFNSYTAKELAASAGKRLPDHAEFQDYAYGTVTGQVSGTNPDTTKHQAGLRSAIGCEQASGAQWEWGNEIWDRGNGSTGYNWYAADTDIRGEVYAAGASSVGVSRYGGQWDDNGKSGSRCSGWVHEAWDSRPHVSARAVCTHTKYGV